MCLHVYNEELSFEAILLLLTVASQLKSETAIVCFFVNLVFGTLGLDCPEIMWRSDVFTSPCLCISHLPACVFHISLLVYCLVYFSVLKLWESMLL